MEEEEKEPATTLATLGAVDSTPAAETTHSASHSELMLCCPSEARSNSADRVITKKVRRDDLEYEDYNETIDDRIERYEKLMKELDARCDVLEVDFQLAK